jgi:hypothetical protein
MKTLILGTLSLFVGTAGWGFESANFNQDRMDRATIQSLIQNEVKAPLAEPDELAQKREEMQRVYNLIQDELLHILPLFVGALEGQGAGYRFSAQELQEICAEVKSKLAYSRSCLHASQVAAGLNKEEVLHLLVRRKKHREIYIARINNLNNSTAKTGVASR